MLTWGPPPLRVLLWGQGLVISPAAGAHSQLCPERRQQCGPPCPRVFQNAKPVPPRLDKSLTSFLPVEQAGTFSNRLLPSKWKGGVARK